MADDSSEVVREQSESVAATNLKSLGDGPGFYHNLSMGNAVAHQQQTATASQAVTTALVKSLLGQPK